MLKIEPETSASPQQMTWCMSRAEKWQGISFLIERTWKDGEVEFIITMKRWYKVDGSAAESQKSTEIEVIRETN
jgi:penicillin-binding protein-related factor A (putative recombinase)